MAEDISGGIRYIKTDCESKLPHKRGKSANPFTKECEKKKIEDSNPLNDDNWVPIDVKKYLLILFINLRLIIVHMISEIDIKLN